MPYITRTCLTLLAALSPAMARTARAVPADLITAVPQESLAVFFADRPEAPEAVAQQQSAMAVATRLLQQLRQGGMLSSLSDDTALFADLAGSLTVLSEDPWALALTDARVESLGGGSHQLDELHAALILKTDGRNQAVTRQIQSLLTARTTTDVSRVDRREEWDTTTFTLIDARLPAWCVIKWAELGPFYVVALGERAFESTARAIRDRKKSLADDQWFARNHARARGDAAQLEWTVNFERMRQSLAPVMGGRLARVLEALDLHNVDRGIWSIGRRERAVMTRTVHSIDGHDILIPISGPPCPGSRCERVIPDQAETYTVISHAPASLIRRVRDTFIAAQRPSVHTRIDRAWRDFEQETELDVEAELLAQLGEHIVIHTYPPHPLRVPLLCTVLFEIDGSSARVSRSLDAILGRLAAWLRGDGSQPSGVAADGFFVPALLRSDDGVWHFQLGIQGPALAVTDGWIVIGYSPRAVRQNLELLQAHKQPAQEPAGATSDPN